MNYDYNNAINNEEQNLLLIPLRIKPVHYFNYKFSLSGKQLIYFLSYFTDIGEYM